MSWIFICNKLTYFQSISVKNKLSLLWAKNWIELYLVHFFTPSQTYFLSPSVF